MKKGILISVCILSFSNAFAQYIVGNGNGFAFSSVGSSGGEVPLPIELLSFTTNCNHQNIILTWSTATETNNDFFTLERSADGISFTSIGTVKGAGNSSAIINYSFTDNLPPSAVGEGSGLRYYRLKQTDLNGKFEYADLIAAENCKNDLSELMVYPNPTNGIVTVESSENNYELILTDLLGGKIYSQNNQSEKAEIDLSNQQNGIYLLQLKSENGTASRKIILNK